MKRKQIFQAAGLLLALFIFTVPVMAQTDPPPIGPDSDTQGLLAYFNWLAFGLQFAATVLLGYLSKFFPGIGSIPNKYTRIAALALVSGLFIFVSVGAGKPIFEVISQLIGFILASEVIYPKVLKPMGLKTVSRQNISRAA